MLIHNTIRKSNISLVSLSISIICLGLYIIFFKLGYVSSPVIFWFFSILAIIGLISGAIINEQDKHIYYLFGILIIVWLIRTIFIPNNGVIYFGSDSFFLLGVTQDIQDNGWFSNPPWGVEFQSRLGYLRSYPILPGISIAITKLTNLSLIFWTRWGFATLSLINIIFIYGITKISYFSRRTALLSAIGFGFIYYNLMFHSQYVYESIAFVFFLATIFSLLKSELSDDIGWRVIAIFTSIAVVLTHHLTAFILLIFLILRYFVNVITKKLDSNKLNIKFHNWSFFMLFIVLLFAYWVYLRYTPFEIAAHLLEEAFRDYSIASILDLEAPATFRFKLTVLIQGISSVGFGVLAIYCSFLDDKSDRNWKFTSVLWGGLLGLITFLGLLGVLGKFNSFPSRMEIFGYALLIPVAAHSISQPKEKKIIKYLFILILFLHCISSLLRVAPILYSDTEVDLSAGEIRPLLLEQEYDAIRKVRPELSGILGEAFRRWDRIANLLSISIEDNSSDYLLHSGGFDFIMIGQADHYRDPRNLDAIISSQRVNKIYDSGWTEFFVPIKNSVWSIESVLDFNTRSKKNYPILDNISPSSELANWLMLALYLVLFSCFGMFIIWMIKLSKSENLFLLTQGEQATAIVIGLLMLSLGFLLFDYINNQSIYLIILPLLLILVSLLFLIFIRFLLRNHRKGNIAIHVKSLSLKNFSLLMLLISLLLMSAGFQYASNYYKNDSYTEFYILDTRFNPNGDKVDSTIVLNNHGVVPLQYYVEVFIAGKLINNIENIQLQPGETWRRNLSIDFPTDTRFPESISFNLNSAQTYNVDQSLKLWVGSNVLQ